MARSNPRVRSVTVSDLWDASLSVSNGDRCTLTIQHGTVDAPKKVVLSLNGSLVEYLSDRLIDAAEQMAKCANAHLAAIRERAARRPS